MKKLLIVFCLLSPLAMSGEPVKTMSLDAALEKAARENKIVMVDFYKPWCNDCQKMDTYTWTDDNVREFLGENTIAIKVNTDEHPDLIEKYRLRYDSVQVFLRSDGTVLKKYRGAQSSRQFLNRAEKLIKKERVHMRAAEGNDRGSGQSR